MELNSKAFGAILAGIYFVILYFQSRFKSFIGMAFVCFVIALLKIFIANSPQKQMLISTAVLIIMAACSVREAKLFEEQGKGVEALLPSRKNLLFGLMLLGIYMLSRIFYFDRIQK